MPKFRVFEDQGVMLDGGDPGPPRWIALRWGRDDCLVQVGAGVGSDSIEEVDEESAASQWGNLNSRHQINQLIRELRHARDQAFGRDE